VPETKEKIMKALVATAETQGSRKSDFTNCIDGELVWMLDPCPVSRRSPDGPCGCGRSFSGLSSHAYTTTAVVREIPGLTRQDYEKALRASFRAQGWCPCCTSKSVREIVDELINLASIWTDGTVVGRRLGAVMARHR
jgi:hypothetical protein